MGLIRKLFFFFIIVLNISGTANAFVDTGNNVIYSPANNNIGIGLKNPTTKLDINGQIMIRGGSPATGKFLQSDANGKASWNSVTSISNASTLDGLDSTQFLRADTSTSFSSGTLTVAGGTTLDINSTNVSIVDTNIALDGASSTFTSTGAMSLVSGSTIGLTPASGSNINFTLAGAGDLAVNTDQLYVDSSAAKVGINNASPATALDVVGTIKSSAQINGATANFTAGNITTVNSTTVANSGTVSTAKLLASGSVNGATANFTTANVSANANVGRLLSSANINGTYAVLSGNLNVAKVLASANVNGTVSNFTTANISGTTTTGAFKMAAGAAANYIFASDGAGNAAWTNPSIILSNGSVFINALNDAISDKNSNLFLGNGSGLNNAGEYNTAVGILSLGENTSGNGNTALGYKAGNPNTSGNFNVALGSYTLNANDLGAGNIALGHEAAFTTNGDYNTALGFQSGKLISTGDKNITLGYKAGDNLTTGSSNIIIGDDLNAPSATASNQMYLGGILFGNTSTGNIGLGDVTPVARLDVGGGSADFIDGTDDLIVKDDIEVDGDAFITANANVGRLLSGANINGTYAVLSGNLNVAKVLASANVNGTVANFTTGNIATVNSTTVANSGTVSTAKLLASGSVNGATANFTTANVSANANVGRVLSSANINGTYAVLSGNLNVAKVLASANVNGTVSNFTTANISGTTTTGAFKMAAGAAANYIFASDGAGNAAWTNPSIILSNGSVFINALNDAISDKNSNLFLGNGSGLNNAGEYNTAVGILALGENVSGNGNTALGYKAGNPNTSGNFNVALGSYTLNANDLGIGNIALGHQAAFTTNGDYNTALGFESGKLISTGDKNITLGYKAGDNLTTGSSNIIIGDDLNAPSATASNQMYLGGILFGNTSTGNIGLGDVTPVARLDVGGGSADFIDGTDDLIVKDDIEVDGDGFITGNANVGRLLSGANINGTYAVFSGNVNAAKILASANVNGTVANFTTANVSGTTNTAKLLASGSVNGATANFTTGNITNIAATKMIASGSVNGATANFTTGNITNIAATKMIASGSVNGATANFTTGNITNIAATKMIASGSVNGATGNFSNVVVSGIFNGATTSFDGDFTNGSILFSNADGVISQSNSQLYWDKNNSRLGVSLTSPTTAVDINGQIMIRGGSPGAGKFLQSDTNGKASWASISSISNASTLDGLDSTQFLRADASTSFSSGTLTVAGGTTLDINSTNVSIADTNIAFDGASTTFTGTGAMTITPGSGTNLNVSLATTGDLAVNTDQLYVDTSAAKVGINNASPATALDVVGTIKSSAQVNGATANFTTGNITNIAATKMIASGSVNGATANFTTGNITNIAATKMIASGSVNGATGNFSNVIVSGIFNGATTSFDGDFTNGSIMFSNAGGVLTQANSQLYFDRVNNRLAVGIGSASEKATINGNLALREGSAPSGTLNFGKIYTNSSNHKIYYVNNGGTAFNLQNGSAAAVGGSNTWFQFNDSSALGGNGAIAFTKASKTLTIPADAPLDINSTTVSIADTNISFDGASTTFTGTGAMTITPGSGTNLNVSLATTGDLAVNTNQLYVDTSAAKVGINNSSPATALDVTGTIKSSTQVNGATANFTTGNITNIAATKMIASGSVNGATGNFSNLVVSGIFNGTTTSFDGDFTNGSIMFSNADGVLTQANSQLYFDRVNNRLAVGIGSASEKATINGNLALREGSAPSQTSNFGKFYVNSSNSKPYFLNDSGTSYNLTNGAVAYWSLSSSSLYPNSTSYKTALGHTSPDTILDLNGAVSFRAYVASSGGGGGGGANPPTYESYDDDENMGALSIPMPSGVTANDILVLLIADISGSAVSTPSGWTAIGEADTNNIRAAAFQQVSNGSTSDVSYTCQTMQCTGYILRYSNGDTSDVVNIYGTSSTNAENAVAPAVTTTAVNTSIIRFVVTADGTADNFGSYPGSHTGIANHRTAASPTLHSAVAVTTQATAASTGTASFAFTRFGITVDTSAITIAINSTPSAGSTAPDDPDNGAAAIWLSGDSGSNGDLLLKTNIDGTTKTFTLYDYSTNGINASTVGSLSASQFLRSDASDSYTSGTLTFDSGTTVDINSTSVSIADTNIAFDGASTTFTGTGAMTITPGSGTNLNVSLATTGDLAVNTNQLYVDTSAAKVGVNNSSPATALDVTGTIKASAQVNGATANFTTGNITNIAATKMIASGSVNGATGNFTTGNITNIAATKMIASGSVNGATGNFTNLVVSGIFNGTTTSFDGDFTNGSIMFSNAGGVLTQANSQLYFDRVNNRLAVGIGSASEKATINGNLALREGSAPSGTLNFGKIYTNSSNHKLYYVNNGGTAFNLQNGAAAAVGGSNTWFQFNDSSALGGNGAIAFTKASKTLTIPADAPLDINSTTVSIADTNISFDGASTTFTGTGAMTITPGSGTNLNVSLATTGDLAVNTDQLYVDTSAAKVGVNNSSPATALDVVGTIKASGQINGATANFTTGNITNIAATKMIASGSVNGATGNFSNVIVSGIFNGATTSFDGDFTNGSILFSNAGGVISQSNSQLYWDRNNSRLGVSLTSPTTAVDINGQIMIRGGSPSAGKFLQSDANGKASWASLSSISNASTLDGLDSTQFLRADASTSFSSGTLTVAGGTTLDINSTSVSIADTDLTLDGASTTFTQTTGAITMLPANGSNMNVRLDGVSDFIIDTSKLVLNNNGNLGLSYVNPQYTLAVNGTAFTKAFALNGSALTLTQGALMYSKIAGSASTLAKGTDHYTLKVNGNALAWEPAGSSVAGSTKQIQFNNGGTQSASANLTFNGGVLKINNTAVFGSEYNAGNSSTSATVNWNLGNRQYITMTGNCTLTLTAPQGTGNFLLRIIQDGTGGRTMTWPAAVKWPSGIAPTLSTAAAAVDIISCYYNGTNYYCSGSLDFQ